MIKLIESKEVEGIEEDFDTCSCSDCKWEGKITDCETVVDSEGWEYPNYHYHVCPECEDGGRIEDYWSSRKRKMEKNDFDIFDDLMRKWGVAAESMEIGTDYAEHFGDDVKTPLSVVKFKPKKIRNSKGTKFINDNSRKIIGYSDSVAEFIFDQEGSFLGVGLWEE